MNDRELLELAAKAAGIAGRFDVDCIRTDLGQGSCGSTCWNPLKDDGDALRLAVKLGMEIHTYVVPLYIEDIPYVEVMVYWWNERTKELVVIKVKEYFDSDQYAATRRAIVRTAAEIGKKMNEH